MSGKWLAVSGRPFPKAFSERKVARFLSRLSRAPALRKIRRKAIEIHLVSGSTLRSLNRKILKHNRNTDVIALDYGLSSKPPKGFVDAEIFISVDAARRQAPLWGHTLRQELAFLIAHGLLHLAGLSDKIKRARLRMWRIQEQLIRML